MSRAFSLKLPLGKCDYTLLMISQYWLRQWLGAVRHQAITWLDVDQILWCHVVSLGHNKLNFNLLRTHRNTFALSIVSQHLDHIDGIGCLNPSSWKTQTPLSYLVNTMSADDLAMQGAMVICSHCIDFWNVPVWAPWEGQLIEPEQCMHICLRLDHHCFR